jgi:hypothetical protein
MTILRYPNNRGTILKLEEVGDDVILSMNNPDHPELKVNVAIIQAVGHHGLNIRSLL